MSPEETTARIAQLEAKAKARRGKTGFERNVAEIEAEIARLKGDGDGD